jgi:hypothetical protein
VGIFDRGDGAHLAVTPAVVSPRQSIQATVTTDRPLARVSSAVLEWGYTNFYRYHWAGRADSAASAMNDSIWMMDQVGTNYGSDRNTDDWVGVTKVELPLTSSEFAGASSTFQVPSWAPASSPLIAQWACRLTVERSGRDVEARGDFDVVIGPADVQVGDALVQRTDGSGDTDIDIALRSSIFRAGQTIEGQITLMPHTDLPDGDVAVYTQAHRASHPLTRSPAVGEQIDGRILPLVKGIPLRANIPVVLPFALALPENSPPTASAVHSSLSWFVAVRMFYKGFTSHQIERVRRQIVVVNAS